MSSTTSRRRSLRIVTLVGACLLTMIATPALAAPAAAVKPLCGNATLKGTYTFASDGWTVSGGSTTPFALAGVETYDGAGSATGVVTSSLNGVITPGTPNTATYHINPDCSGTAAFTNSGITTHFDLYVAPDGDFFQFVGTDAGAVTSSTETRVFK